MLRGPERGCLYRFAPLNSMQPTCTLLEGRRYRLRGRNASDDVQPLHRHSFELARIGGKPSAGVVKDVVMPGGFQELERDVVTDNPGLTLFHRRQHPHLDFGLMASF